MRVALVKGNVGRRCGLVVEGLVPGQARRFLLTVEWTFEVRWGFYRLELEPYHWINRSSGETKNLYYRRGWLVNADMMEIFHSDKKYHHLQNP